MKRKNLKKFKKLQKDSQKQFQIFIYWVKKNEIKLKKKSLSRLNLLNKNQEFLTGITI